MLADADASTFVPPGSIVCPYHASGQSFEIWCASLKDPRALVILQNMQVLVPLFIEGGTILELQYPWIVERWKIFFLYQVDSSPPPQTSKYSLAGYSTSYRVFTLPERLVQSEAAPAPLHSSETDFDKVISKWSQDGGDKSADTSLSLLSRERISQFIILPPYQGAGHGAQLYNTMYAELTSPSNVWELTVEDPNEAFDDMRDACDLLHLRSKNSDFANLSINTKVDAAKLKPSANLPMSDIIDGSTKERISKASKIMPRQLARLIEMQTLSKIPRSNRSVNRITRKEKSSNEHDRAYYFWRLYVKQRLYVHNRDSLVQLDREERIERLDQALEGLQDDYVRLLELADKRARHASNGHSEPVSSSPRLNRKKRRVVEEDDEDEDDEGEDDEEMSEASSKRRKKA